MASVYANEDYFVQLLVILWLVLDRSEGQHTTDRVIALALSPVAAFWSPTESAI